MKRSRPLFLEPHRRSHPTDLAFLLSLPPSGATLGLGNIRRLLFELGNPHEEFKSILIAGTNGKGTLTAVLASILNENGHLTGRFISPHVFEVSERINVGGAPVSMEEMEEAAGIVAGLHERIDFSYFEALTALAFLIFARRKVEFAVLEVGLGGRFDATNVVDPCLGVITGIALDHRRLLGDSPKEILREKLGIARKEVPLLCGELGESLMAELRARAKRQEFPVIELVDIGDVSLVEMSFESMRIKLRTKCKDYGVCTTRFLGEHQMKNALLAVGASELILGNVKKLDTALKKAYLPGRFEAFNLGAKRAILDVAHNDQALCATLKTLAKLCQAEASAIVLGVLRRKELLDFPSFVSSAAARMYLIEAVREEAYSAPELLAIFAPEKLRSSGLDVVLSPRMWEEGRARHFLECLFHPGSPHDNILITGSHRTVEALGCYIYGQADKDEESTHRS